MPFRTAASNRRRVQRNLLLSEWPTTYAADLVFDYKSGNATAPSTGPALTANGTITERGEKTVWRDVQGPPVLGTVFADGASYTTATTINPGASDVVLATLFRVQSTDLAYIASTYLSTGAAKGWVLYVANGVSPRLAVYGDTAQSANKNSSITLGAWTFCIGKIDRSANISLYVNALSVATDPAPAGAIDSSDGFGLNGTPAGSLDRANTVARMQIYHMTDCNTFDHASFYASVMARSRAA